MNKILVITTKGCEACNIAVNNVKTAINQTSKNINLEITDYNNIDRHFLKKERIKDFPAIVYFVDDKIMNKSIGTNPIIVYLRWIDMFFKK